MNKNNKKPVHKSNATSSKTSSQKQPNNNKPSVAPQKQAKLDKQTSKSKPATAPSVPEDFPHFRRYTKSKHPALIVGEKIDEMQKEEYKYRKVMHNKTDGDRTNEEVIPNPDPNDPQPMYIGKRVRHDEKRFFGKRLPWKYPKK